MNVSQITQVINSALLFIKPKYRNQRIWRLSIRAILALLCFFFFTFFLLRKIYEVPVNYTEIGIYHQSNIIKHSNIDVVLCRDYDRNRSASIQKQITGENQTGINKTGDEKWEQPGGLTISGFVWLENRLADSDNIIEHHDLDSLYDSAIKNMSIVKDSVGSMFYLYARGTRRQFLFQINRDSVVIPNEYKDSLYTLWDEIYLYEKSRVIDLAQMLNVDKSHGVKVHHINELTRLRATPTEVCKDKFLLSSHQDTIVPVYLSLNGGDYKKPKVFETLEDISKAVEIINIRSRCMQYVRSLTIDYKGAADFGYLYPEPDEKTMNSIRYTDRNKLNVIGTYGLKYHVSFPDMENLQNIRILILTAIVTLLFTIFVTLIYKILSKPIKMFWLKHPNICFSFIIVIVIFTLLLWIWAENASFIDAQGLQLKIPNFDH